MPVQGLLIHEQNIVFSVGKKYLQWIFSTHVGAVNNEFVF